MNIYRQKLLNAVLFFISKRIKHLNTTKLMKLLYFFDFTHVKQTGYPAIGLKYFTFQRGPVPKDFWLEIQEGKVPDDFKGKIVPVPKTDDLNPDYKEYEFRSKSEPEMSVFTPRELEILERLAFMYKEASAREISEVSHLKNQPWDVTKKTKGLQKPIDYMLALDNEAEVSKEEAEDSLKDFFANIDNFCLSPTR
jgi:uncharacterized phage-associated protein